jgi:hypothetical protein
MDKAAPSLVEADVAPAAGSPVAPARGAGVGAARKLRTTDGGPGQRDDDAAAALERTEGSAVPAVASVRAARVRALNEGLNGNAPALSQEATPAAGASAEESPEGSAEGSADPLAVQNAVQETSWTDADAATAAAAALSASDGGPTPPVRTAASSVVAPPARPAAPREAPVRAALRGVVPRAAEEVLLAVAAKRALGIAAQVTVSYVEVFGDEVTDLLQGGALCGHSKVAAQRYVLSGATGVVVESVASVAALLARGDAQKRRAATAMNARSSRAHALFVLTLTQRDAAHARSGRVVTSQLYLADLGGSEQVQGFWQGLGGLLPCPALGARVFCERVRQRGSMFCERVRQHVCKPWDPCAERDRAAGNGARTGATT